MYSNFFVALFVMSLCPFDMSVGVGDFVIGLSKISSIFCYLSIAMLKTNTRDFCVVGTCKVMPMYEITISKFFAK